MAVGGRVMQSKKRATWKLWTRHISMAINKTASRNILRKITKLVNNSNDQQRCASASIFCEDPFSSSTPYAEELEYDIDFLINHQDIRQCHFQVIKIELKIAMRKKFIFIFIIIIIIILILIL